MSEKEKRPDGVMLANDGIKIKDKINIENEPQLDRVENKVDRILELLEGQDLSISINTIFTDDQLAVIYRSVYFELNDYLSIDENGYLGNITRNILEIIYKYRKEIANPFYVSENISKAL